jgi:hypothetical protein
MIFILLDLHHGVSTSATDSTNTTDSFGWHGANGQLRIFN